MELPLAISGYVLLGLGILVVFVLGAAYGIFNVKATGINRTPSGKGRGEAGAVGPSEASSNDQGQGSATGSDASGTSDPQHGTK